MCFGAGKGVTFVEVKSHRGTLLVSQERCERDIEFRDFCRKRTFLHRVFGLDNLPFFPALELAGMGHGVIYRCLLHRGRRSDTMSLMLPLFRGRRGRGCPSMPSRSGSCYGGRNYAPTVSVNVLVGTFFLPNHWACSRREGGSSFVVEHR